MGAPLLMCLGFFEVVSSLAGGDAIFVMILISAWTYCDVCLRVRVNALGAGADINTDFVVNLKINLLTVNGFAMDV